VYYKFTIIFVMEPEKENLYHFLGSSIFIMGYRIACLATFAKNNAMYTSNCSPNTFSF